MNEHNHNPEQKREFILSPKYIDFLKHKCSVEFLEGTTAAGKTTVGIVKFLFEVMESPKTEHIISGDSIGVIEKNIINADFGIMEIFQGLIDYYPNGKGKHSLAHMRFKTRYGDKVIYTLGYGDVSKWKLALGGQYGCVYIDEVNTANIKFVREVAMRCDYLMGTLNPDDPNKEVYSEFINRSRPIEKYKNDAPLELLKQLHSEPAKAGWTWWFFDFNDNAGLSEEKINNIKNSVAPGTKEYKNRILGLRGKSTGLIFNNFDETKHVVKLGTDAYNHLKTIYENTEKKVRNPEAEKFIYFTAGLDTSYSANSDDTFAMSFLGITNKRNVYLLDECVINNRDLRIPLAPSDLVVRYIQFLDENRNKWGFARDSFIDSADQATMKELAKYKLKNGSLYNFNNAYKKIKILDRINLQLNWFAKGNFFILGHCENYIAELNTYSWQENKPEPEDANDHMINSVQYAWIPYINYIGTVG